MARIGYARVSTTEQHPEAQAERLLAAGCDRIFTDHGVSGKLASRPEWDKCLSHLRDGDALVITKLDRAGRSLAHLIEVSGRLRAAGVDLIVLDQGIDTSNPAGRLFFHIVGAMAEFERDLISDRTKDGLAASGKRGRSGGRKPKLQPYQVTYAQAQIDGGRSATDVAAELDVHRATLYRELGAAASSAPAGANPE